MIALDAQLTLGTPTGIGEYLRGLIPALQAAGVDVVALRNEARDPWRFDRRVLWDQWDLPRLARSAELLHCTAGTVPLSWRKPFVVTVHDVAWFRVQQHARAYARAYFGPLMLAKYRKAQGVIVDSEFSRDELLSLGGFDAERVSVVYPGVASDFFFDVPSEAAASRPRIILAVGTVERRKNLAVVIRALARMRESDVVLVAAGPPTPYQAECGALAAELGIANRVRFAGYVPREELLALYASAAVAVVPSRYEGFGYAAAQALVCGTPVLAARTSSLIEVVADEAALLPVDDVDAWTRALDAVCAEPQTARDRARNACARARREFDWALAGAQTLASYAQALHRPPVG